MVIVYLRHWCLFLIAFQITRYTCFENNFGCSRLKYETFNFLGCLFRTGLFVSEKMNNSFLVPSSWIEVTVTIIFCTHIIIGVFPLTTALPLCFNTRTTTCCCIPEKTKWCHTWKVHVLSYVTIFRISLLFNIIWRVS